MRARARMAAALGLAFAAATPAAASTLSPVEIGTSFCLARISGDMAGVLPLLTVELGALVAAAGGDGKVGWQSTPGRPDMCMPVGTRGTVEAPESVLSYVYTTPGHRNFSDTLVLRFVDGELRIDDVKFADGTTLRERLAGD